MSEIKRLQQLAGIYVNESEEEVTKTAVGHVDDEMKAIHNQLYQIGKYSVELHKLIKNLPDNTDFPHWIQNKITKSLDYIDAVKHYLESEIEAPEDAEYSEPDPEITSVDPS